MRFAVLSLSFRCHFTGSFTGSFAVLSLSFHGFFRCSRVLSLSFRCPFAGPFAVLSRVLPPVSAVMLLRRIARSPASIKSTGWLSKGSKGRVAAAVSAVAVSARARNDGAVGPNDVKHMYQ